jgi:hypothetical protein
MGRWWGALIASVVACICAREASACSSDSAPQSVRPLDDEFFLHGAPANRLFYRDNGEPTEVFENWSGPPPVFEVDQAWTVRANRGTDGDQDFLPDLTTSRSRSARAARTIATCVSPSCSASQASPIRLSVVWSITRQSIGHSSVTPSSTTVP